MALQVIGHRGASGTRPENTLVSFRRAVELGAHMVELDAQLTADGHVVVLHDDTLDRTTNARGRADGYSWRELSRLDAGTWHSAPYAGETLPTLAAVASFARAHKFAVNVEIKPMPGRERETGAAVALDAKSLWSGVATPPLLSSFSEVALEAARDAAPELPRAYLLDELPGDWRERALGLECVALDFRHTLLTGALVRDVRAAGFRVLAWTVNDPRRVDALDEFGVDSVITDAIDIVSPDVADDETA